MVTTSNISDRHPSVDTDDTLAHIGQQLRDARLSRGEDLYHVAEQLRIKSSYLSALEVGDLSSIPGRPYALGFMRSYADYLGFDGDQVVASVKAAESRGLRDPELHYRTPIAESRRPGVAVLVASAVLVVAGYGVWYGFFASERPVAKRVSTLPSDVGEFAVDLFEATPGDGANPVGTRNAGQQVAPEGETRVADVSPTIGEPRLESRVADAEPVTLPDGRLTDDPSAPAVETARAGVEALETEDQVTVPVQDDPPSPELEDTSQVVTGVEATRDNGVDDATQTQSLNVAAADADLAQTSREYGTEDSDASSGDEISARDLLATLGGNGVEAEPRLFGAVDSDPQVILVADAPSWIQVRSESRDYVRTRTLEAGDRFLLPNRNDLALWTGNAGGLQIIVDGEWLGSLGASGEVMRDISLTPESLVNHSRLGQGGT